MKRRTRQHHDLSGVPSHLTLLPWSGPAAVPDPGGDYQRWVTARAGWVAAGNAWPGGEEARTAEESEAIYSMPDELLNVSAMFGRRSSLDRNSPEVED